MTYRDAVLALADRLSGVDVAWAVTASANLALRGFAVEPGDVDVMTDAAGTYRLADAFPEAVVRPVVPPERAEHDDIRSHFGALELHGVEVELMGAVEHRIDGEWSPAADVADRREFLEVRGRPVPVMPLAHERRAYRALGRDGRLALLEAARP